MIDQDISRWLASTKIFWSFHMVIQEPERQSSYLALIGVKLGESRLDRVDLEAELYKKTSVLCLVFSLNPLLKIR